jgi:hypothetical protein
MKKLLLLLLPLLAASAFAAPCGSGQYDMMNWLVMSSSMSQTYHLASNANPQYTFHGNGIFYRIKGSAGYPWDVNYYDNNYVYQWATEYKWSDPSSYKSFSAIATMPWSPRCVNKPPTGVYGKKLASIMLASSPYTIYGGSCSVKSNNNLGFVVNEIWGPSPLSLGGSLPQNALTLTLSYRYSCNSSYGSCKHKEVFDFQKPYGLVRWTYYVLQNGQYVQQSQSLFNRVVKGGPPAPVHPCW